MKLVPLADRVVLKQMAAEEKTKSGIILTSQAQEKPQEAEVIAVGPGTEDVKMEVKVGDKVIYSKYAGTEVKLYTHFQVSETGMSLFGFLDRADLELFRLLIGVNGVGPRSALGILSAMAPDALRIAVVSRDAKALTKAPGVGTKTAQRILLDLKDKIRAEDLLTADAPSLEAAEGISAGFGEAAKEAAEALTALGYSAGEAQSAVRKAAAEGMTAEEILKASLKYLAIF